MQLTALILAAIVATPAIASAQSSSSIDPAPPVGSRVRVTSVALGRAPVTGTLMSETIDSITFQPTGFTTTTALGTSQVTRLEVSRGTHRRVFKSALIGFVVGAAAAGAIGYATWQKTSGFDFGRGADAAADASIGGLAGGLVGGLVGAKPVESWQSVSIPRS